jgi:DNA-binding response OmpR family regulator
MRLYTSITKKIAPKEQLLIIDSEWNMLKLLYAVLSNNYDLTVKNSSLDAMHWLENGNKPALIITEYQLPYIDGATLIKHLKHSGIHNDTPIIMLSDESDLEKKMDNLPFNNGAFISKPFNPFQLISKIKSLINDRNSASA